LAPGPLLTITRRSRFAFLGRSTDTLARRTEGALVFKRLGDALVSDFARLTPVAFFRTAPDLIPAGLTSPRVSPAETALAERFLRVAEARDFGGSGETRRTGGADCTFFPTGRREALLARRGCDRDFTVAGTLAARGFLLAIGYLTSWGRSE
jgi:hypothetical protein